MPISVIDLFAGPGGLGEGFSALRHGDGPVFRIKLSIEKDKHAHATLQLRAFFRQFDHGMAPEDYYAHLAGRVSRDHLFSKFPEQAEKAVREAWHAELGGKDFPNVVIDERIRDALGIRANWVLIGGPPCQAYSLAGRSRRKNDPGFAADEKHFLYRQYLRILAVHQPPVFVMENVKGLLSAKIKQERIFDRILADLRKPATAARIGVNVTAQEPLEYNLFPLSEGIGELLQSRQRRHGRQDLLLHFADETRVSLRQFEPHDFVLCAEDYGIPQARHRIIIVGIRSDLTVKPGELRKSPSVKIEEVIGDLPKLRSVLSKEKDSPEAWRDAVREVVSGKWFSSTDFGTDLCEALYRASKRVGVSLNRGGSYVPETANPQRHADWFVDAKLKGVCNHETRGHIRADLHRYFFAAVLARKEGRSPLLEDLPKALLPKHKNVADALMNTKFNDRFRVQIAGRPSTTIVSHISKDGHYFIHYDPAQCRSLTVREAARLQTFPDNYFFEGPRTEQYHQVGNAVPPLLAHQIAKVVANLFP